MSKFVDAVRSEPVRIYVYGLVSAVVALLVFMGVLTGAAVPFVIAVVVAALALPSPVEAARARVTPVERDSSNVS